ncbi:hypothetical protein [Actinoplanes sp. NPDC049118]|uniref:hypothetical protein n=1 Tax=Actinoplanes sp. NPDC049118 TaxID=3155769 RepID=UPI0033C6DBF5
MTDSTTCICCAIFRPDATPRTPTDGPVCAVCRWRLRRDVVAIGRLHRDLTTPELVDGDRRLVEVVDDEGNPTGMHRWADPAAAVLPVGAVPARSGQPIVTGTRAHSTPIDLDTIDLIAPANHVTVHDPYNDQIGYISAATILDSWCRALHVTVFPFEPRPDATVPTLVSWLTGGFPESRMDSVCSQYPAIPDLAGEIRRLCIAMRGAAGETELKPQVLWGVPCRRCNLVSHLLRDEEYIECGNCQLLLTDAEYRTWVAEATKRFGARPAVTSQD